MTGAANLDTQSVADKVATIKVVTNIPVGVGFGIRDPESAARIAAVSDAVVVGTVLVSRIAQLLETPQRIPKEIGSIIASMRVAMDEGGSR